MLGIYKEQWSEETSWPFLALLLAKWVIPGGRVFLCEVAVLDRKGGSGGCHWYLSSCHARVRAAVTPSCGCMMFSFLQCAGALQSTLPCSYDCRYWF